MLQRGIARSLYPDDSVFTAYFCRRELLWDFLLLPDCSLFFFFFSCGFSECRTRVQFLLICTTSRGSRTIHQGEWGQFPPSFDLPESYRISRGIDALNGGPAALGPDVH